MTSEKAPAKTGPATISAAKLAALLMISPRRVQQLAQAGVIPKTGRDAYPLVGAIQGYLRWLDDESRRAAQAASAIKVAEARATEIEQRIAAKMKTLIPIEDHRGVVAGLVRVVRREVEKVPANLPAHVRERARIEINRSLAVINKTAADAAKKAEPGEQIF
ncbi:MAG: hypothetical protein WBA44_13150 [Mesorhizobium sp.]